MINNLPEKVQIHEVGLRDGLQNEEIIVPTELKIKWAEQLIASGIKIIQLGSFVHPKRVPQMADSDELFRLVTAKYADDVTFSGLVLNQRGLERGLDCGVDLLCMGVSASNTHSLKNTGMSTSEAVPVILKMADEAQEAERKVQVSVQSAFGCGFEGRIDEPAVLSIVQQYLDAGYRNISLADTAGHAYPTQVQRLIDKCMQLDNDIKLTCHFHNTYGLGMANCLAALEMGVVTFESSFGGLGGCPFTKSASGNVATEDFAHSISRMGISHGVSLAGIIELSKEVEAYFGKTLEGTLYKAAILEYGE